MRLWPEIPAAAPQRQVALLHRALAQQRVQRAQRGAAARDDQTAAGVAIQPVRQLEGLARAARRAAPR